MERHHRRPIPRLWLGVLALLGALPSGCETPSAHTWSRDYSLRGEVPVDPPGSGPLQDGYDRTGGELYKQYCGSCHNARPLGERPFSNYEVVVAHMRDQAYLTGEEYRQIIHFLRRWHDIGPATPPVEPSPKRFVPSQPISELRGEAGGGAPIPPPPAGPGPFQGGGGAAAAAAPGQPGQPDAMGPLN